MNKRGTMKNYISINDQKIALTDEQVKQIMGACSIPQKPLSAFAPGETVKIGNFEMVVLEQQEGQTALILKGVYAREAQFGEDNNDYRDSNVDERCQQFAQELSEIIGWDNIVLHEVDLTSDDGLKDYGTIERRASLLTADMYRKFVEILDTVNPDCWWWLATPWSTKRHGNEVAAKCVSPSGLIYYHGYRGDYAVRPFCILKSNIFVSD